MLVAILVLVSLFAVSYAFSKVNEAIKRLPSDIGKINKEFLAGMDKTNKKLDELSARSEKFWKDRQ